MSSPNAEHVARRLAREDKLRAEIAALVDEHGNLRPRRDGVAPAWLRRSAR